MLVEWYDGQDWVTPAVYGRPAETRANPVYTVGNATVGDEINEGGYVINQLPPGESYRLTVTKNGYPTAQVTVPVTTGWVIQDIAL